MLQQLISGKQIFKKGTREFKLRKMTYKRKKYHYGDTHLKKKWRTKRRTRDLDQIDSDLTPENAEKLLSQPVDLDKSGNGQFYCVHCAKYLIDQRAFQVRKFDIFRIISSEAPASLRANLFRFDSLFEKSGKTKSVKTANMKYHFNFPNFFDRLDFPFNLTIFLENPGKQ